MLPKPPEPHIGSIDGTTYISLSSYVVKFADWLAPLQFEIDKGTPTDIASVPWFLRCFCDRAGLGLTAPFFHDYMSERQGKLTNLDGKEIQISWFDTQLFFLVAMRLDGIPPMRAFLAFIAVLIANRPIWK